MLNVYEPDIAIEIDIGTFDMIGDTSYHNRFVMLGESGYTLLTYRANTTIGWSAYFSSGWSSTIYGSLTNRNAFANSTVRLEVSDTRYVTLYVNGVEIGTSTVKSPTSYVDGKILIGSIDEASKGGQLYNAVITGIRVYKGGEAS